MSETSRGPGDRGLAPGDSVVVVGGTGLIGSALGRVLAGCGLRPLLVSRHAPKAAQVAAGALHLCLERHDVPRLLERGEFSTPHGTLGVIDVLANSPAEVEPLLAAAARRAGRFVAIGSAAVFGRSPDGFRYAETHVVAPATDAMRLKVAVEDSIAHANAAGHGATVLRLSYPYGPGHGPLTPLGREHRIFADLAAGRRVTWVKPDALAPLQPLWTDDLARGIAALLMRDAKPRPVYHVTGPETLTWEAYLGLLARGARTEGVSLLSVDELLTLAPNAWWLRDYLPEAPLLADTLFRAEVYACETRLVDTAEAWAQWCAAAAEQS